MSCTKMFDRDCMRNRVGGVDAAILLYSITLIKIFNFLVKMGRVRLSAAIIGRVIVGRHLIFGNFQ